MRAETGTISSKSAGSPRARRAAAGASAWATRSTLFRTRSAARARCLTSSRANRSPAPAGSVASMTRRRRPPRGSPPCASSSMARFSRWSGLWRPGVSTKTICPSCAVPDPEDAPARRLRLVGDDRDLRPDEGVHERRLPRVRPPDDRHRPGAAGSLGPRPAVVADASHHPHAVDAPAVRLLHGERQPALLRPLARASGCARGARRRGPPRCRTRPAAGRRRRAVAISETRTRPATVKPPRRAG